MHLFLMNMITGINDKSLGGDCIGTPCLGGARGFTVLGPWAQPQSYSLWEAQESLRESQAFMIWGRA